MRLSGTIPILWNRYPRHLCRLLSSLSDKVHLSGHVSTLRVLSFIEESSFGNYEQKPLRENSSVVKLSWLSYRGKDGKKSGTNSALYCLEFLGSFDRKPCQSLKSQN